MISPDAKDLGIEVPEDRGRRGQRGLCSLAWEDAWTNIEVNICFSFHVMFARYIMVWNHNIKKCSCAHALIAAFVFLCLSRI